jgi:hypothetical protein
MARPLQSDRDAKTMERVMLKKITAGVSALALMGFATSAMAQQMGNDQYQVNVNIEVAEEVSMWAGHQDVELLMDGQDENNSATFESSVHHINNVAATISAEVDGTLPSPSVPGGGINFFIFDGVDAGDAVTAITANAYNPAGALVWNQSTLGTSQDMASVGVNQSIANRQVTYASASPGELPLPDSYDLTVVWTITAD